MTLVDSRPSGTPKSHSSEWLFCVLAGIALCLALGGCAGPEEARKLSGASMGTRWNVSYVADAPAPDAQALQQLVQAQLDAVESTMSTYREDSLISRFNGAAVGQPVQVDAPFIEVLQAAIAVGGHTDGAYDVSVGPLVDLWGFGPGQPVFEPPPATAIAAALARVGQRSIAVDGGAARLTKRRDVALDFSSLAKGYAVDRVAAALQGAGVTRFLVEVGGEMRVAGLSARGDAWRIAIEAPDSATRSVAAALAVRDAAVATSGDYRNFFEVDGVRYSHAIDPRTGYPVTHDLVSVTVVHDSAMLADAWSTALIVMGAQQAQAVAQERGLAVYFIRRSGDDFAHSYTAAIEPYLQSGPTPAQEVTP